MIAEKHPITQKKENYLTRNGLPIKWNQYVQNCSVKFMIKYMTDTY